MTYLDHAATTPMLPEALAAMAAELGRVGNPSSLHGSGRAARRVVEESRETLARALNCRPSEIVFTSGGTQADNLAVKGLYWSRRAADPARRRVLISAVEHHAVLDPAAWLAEAQGAELEILPVDEWGRLRPETLRGRDRVRPRLGRAGVGDVGEQRGRHRPADRGADPRSRTPTTSRSTPTPSRRWGRCRSTSPPSASTR